MRTIGSDGVLDVQIHVDEKQLQEVIRKLDRARVNVPQAIRNVLNRVARDARKQIVQRARAVYYFKPGFKIGNIELTPASAATLTATLKAQSRPRTMRQYDFGVTKAGVKARVLRSGSRKFLGYDKMRAFVNDSIQGGLIMHRKLRKRYPLETDYGPSEANMYKQAFVGAHGGGPMQGLIEARLARELNVELAKYV